MTIKLTASLIALPLVLAACTAPTPALTPTATPASSPAPTPTPALTPGPLPDLNVERAFPNLNFQRLTNLLQPDDGLDRIFVTEQAGRILVFPDDQQATQATVFLDIRDRVNEGGNEEGFLGLAFDPGFADNGYIYVYYSAASPRRSVLARFSVSPGDPARADPSSELVVIEIPQPYSNHNGGQLAFGPDGYLYVGLGDGGSGGDPHGNGQDPGTLLGSILRIDLSDSSAEEPYRVPGDNPFVDVPGARGEVWAYGLRNPWRFSFDAKTGLMWAADVGQNRWEEINVVRKGLNYGWNIMEGSHCYSPGTGCDASGLEMPLAEYDHSLGCSVTGGYVERGDRLPSLYGAYVYADFCSGLVWGLRYDGQAVTRHKLLLDSGLAITSFGVDLDGNLYVLSRDQGIYRFVEG